ncbi:Tachykinin-like peptide receptor 86C, partial [Dinothrombium tinctorium]
MAQSNNCSLVPLNFTDDRDFDFNNFQFEKISYGDIPPEKPALEMILKSLLFMVIALIAIFGNYLIIRVIIKFKESRSFTNLFICNMAVADILSVLFCSWAAIVFDYSPFYTLGAFYCKFETFIK